MIDVTKGNLVEVRTLANRVFGDAVASNTCYRWIRKGSNGVRLEAIKAGRKWLTTEAAFNEFLHARTAAALQNETATQSDKDEAAYIDRTLPDSFGE